MELSMCNSFKERANSKANELWKPVCPRSRWRVFNFGKNFRALAK
jgi:hypothetical protein